MNKQIGIAAFAAMVAAFAASPLAAAELSHRWSFNGDYSDSAGGVDAVKCGTYVSLYGGRVHMGYGACSHGTGYVDLGTNMLDTTAATIEIWARSWRRARRLEASAAAGPDAAITVAADGSGALLRLSRTCRTLWYEVEID